MFYLWEDPKENPTEKRVVEHIVRQQRQMTKCMIVETAITEAAAFLQDRSVDEKSRLTEAVSRLRIAESSLARVGEKYVYLRRPERETYR